MEKIFTVTAIWSNNEEKPHYYHFGIHPITASLYGNDPSEIQTIQMKISDNQEKADSNEHLANEPDYWGWYDIKDESFSFIFPKYFLLNMCFPAGIKATEERGQGKAYRLEVVS